MNPDQPHDTSASPDTHEHEHRFEEGEEAVPKGVHAMAITRWLLLFAMIAASFTTVYSYAAPLFGQGAASEKKGSIYRCPMHPQIISDHPGECPICHMALELVPEEQRAKASATAKGDEQAKGSAPEEQRVKASATAKGDEQAKGYWCPMHHEVRSDKPGSCPICHMDLVPIPAAETKHEHAHDTAAPANHAGEPPQGTTPITLSLDRTQAIGVRTAKAERVGASGALRVTAAVEVPEQGLAEVHVRSPGFVEAIRVTQTGVKVKAGQALVAIYSPEIFRAQQELLAMSAWPRAGTAAGGELGPPLGAARKRLELLGIGGATIDRIVASNAPIRAVTLSAPISGYVVKKSVVLGSYVMPETTLFEIADLSRVYIVASVYPHQLAGVRLGDSATFRAPELGGRAFETKVDLIYPDVDLATRTARVRFQVKNDDLLLRPGQFGTIELQSSGSDALAVPLDAVIDTGRSTYVFVVEDQTHFIPRKVEVGEQIDDKFVIRGGVKEGDRVVSGATFLIDAESRLQASLTESRP